MNSRIFLFRELTYCSIFTYPDEAITIIGEVREEITSDGVRRTPIVTVYGSDPVVCPYCFSIHNVPHNDTIYFPRCDRIRKKAIVKDENGIEYQSEADGFYVKHL